MQKKDQRTTNPQQNGDNMSSFTQLSSINEEELSVRISQYFNTFEKGLLVDDQELALIVKWLKIIFEAYMPPHPQKKGSFNLNDPFLEVIRTFNERDVMNAPFSLFIQLNLAKMKCYIMYDAKFSAGILYYIPNPAN